MRPTISRYCLSLGNALVRRTMVVALVAFIASQAFGWTVKSRELVDVEIFPDGALIILVSAPGTELPGLYLWKTGVAVPEKLCAINGPSFFSFNRRIVIERVHGDHDTLVLYNSANCKRLGQIETTGRVMDADARGALAAVAVHYPDDERTLELYTKLGRRIAKTPVGPNVELGFAPDGRTLLNFDLNDTANASSKSQWALRSLVPTDLPKWMNTGEVTFIPGAAFVKRYLNGEMAIVPWSSDKPKFATRLARSVRVRQLSSDGRYGVIHERLPQTDSLAWIDFASGQRVKLGEGSIDHAAISATGSLVAWTERGGTLNDQVTIRRAKLSSSGTLTLEN